MRFHSLLWILFTCLLFTNVFVSNVRCDETVELTDDEGDDAGEAVMEEPEEPEEPADTGKARLSFMVAEPDNLDSITFSKPVKILINLANEARTRKYYFHQISASFRYPADLSYVLQNLTTLRFNSVVEPGTDATFQYGFILHDDYTARSVVLIMEVLYSDDEHQVYEETVVNHTTTILESDTGVDGELIFMYLLLAGLAGAIAFAVYHFTIRKLRGSFAFSSPSKDKKSSSAALSGNLVMKHDVDLEWIPKEILKSHAENRKQAYLRNKARQEDQDSDGDKSPRHMVNGGSDSNGIVANEKVKSK